jgi:hypothetical protein
MTRATLLLLIAGCAAGPAAAHAQRFTFGGGVGWYRFDARSEPPDALYSSTSDAGGVYLSAGVAATSRMDLLASLEGSHHRIDYPNGRDVFKLGIGPRIALRARKDRVRPFLHPEVIWLSESVDDEDPTSYDFLGGTPLAACSDGRSLSLTGGIDIALRGRWSVTPALGVATVSQTDDCSGSMVKGHTIGLRLGLRHAPDMAR